MKLIDSKKSLENLVLLYPNQIKIVEKSPIKVTVIEAYFKGEYYFIEANLNGKTIFFEHTSKLKAGSSQFIEIVN